MRGLPLAYSTSMTRFWATTVVLAAMLPSCAVDDTSFDPLGEHADAPGLNDAQTVTWLMKQAKPIGNLSRRQVLQEFDNDCQYTSQWAMMGNIECLTAITQPGMSCNVDLDDTGFHKFSLPDPTGYTAIQLTVQGAIPLVLCGAGPEFTQCGKRSSLVSGGKTTFFTSFDGITDDAWHQARDVAVASEASVIARKAVKASDPNYVITLSLYKDKLANGTCPPATPAP